MSTNTPANLLNQALEQHRQGQYAEAEQQYQAILQTEPDNFEALHCYALLKQDLKQLDEALELVERAIALRPQAAAYFATAGAIRHAQGDLPAALANLKAAVDLNPNLKQGHNTLGYLQFRMGDLAAAEQSLETALRLEPESDQVMTNLGNVLLAQGRLEEAMATWQQALGVNPQSLAARASLAEGLLQQGAFAIAEQAFRTSLEDRPQAATLHAGLARALLAQGQTADARQAAADGLAHEPENFAALRVGGEAALAAGRSGEAVDLLRRALLVRRGDAATIELLAAALEAQGNLELARQSYQAIADRRPGIDARLLSLRARMGERDAALADLRQLLVDHPQRVDAALILADLLEDPAAALAVLSALPEDRPGDAAGALVAPEQLTLKRAELALASGAAQSTLDLLQPLSVTKLSDLDAASSRELRARALDALGRYGEAATAFKDVITQLHPAQINLRKPAAKLQATSVPDDGRTAPVLMTGLPGCGLGWLAGALNDAAAFEVLTDRIDQPGDRRDFLDSNAQARRGDRPPETHMTLERRAYWKAAERLRRKVSGRVMLVDTIPVSQFDAGLIAHFFPGAIVLAVTRHPGDLLLHARTFGWREGLVPTNAIVEFYTALKRPPAGLDVRWLPVDALRNGQLDPLHTLAGEFNLHAGDLAESFKRHAAHWTDGRWPAGHWRHYRENLALLGPQLSGLATDLGYES